MADPKHTIKKAIVELQVSSQKEAHDLQQRAANVFHHTVRAVLDKLCTQYSPANVLHRIDKLEIDLGTVKKKNFEAELKTKLIKELSGMLEGIVADMARENEGQTDLFESHSELLLGFVKTGQLPWWADLHNRNLLSESLGLIMKESRGDLSGLSRLLRENDRYIRRFVAHIADKELSRFVEVINPNFNLKLIKVLFEAVSAPSKLSKLKSRTTFWFCVLKKLNQNGRGNTKSGDIEWSDLLQLIDLWGFELSVPSGQLAKVLHEVFGRVTMHLHLTDKEKTLPRALEQYGTINTQQQDLYAIITRINSTMQQQDSEVAKVLDEVKLLHGKYSGSYKSDLTQTIGLLQDWERDASSFLRSNLSSFWDARMKRFSERTIDKNDERLLGLIQNWSADRLEAVLKLFYEKIETTFLAAHTNTGLMGKAQSTKHWIELSKQAKQLENRAKQQVNALKLCLKDIEKEVTQKNSKQKNVDSLRVENDIFITNPGLAILAPFIKYLFVALDYMEGVEFVNEEKQVRAALLLQYLCDPQESILEFRMPLAKILCGIDPATYIDTDFTPTAREAEECESLLEIVIVRAEVFKALSNDGFRASFLLRDAKLSPHGKHWLLQVDKKTHDILLGKIPWNFKLLKLPWMQAMVQVDW